MTLFADNIYQQTVKPKHITLVNHIDSSIFIRNRDISALKSNLPEDKKSMNIYIPSTPNESVTVSTPTRLPFPRQNLVPSQYQSKSQVYTQHTSIPQLILMEREPQVVEKTRRRIIFSCLHKNKEAHTEMREQCREPTMATTLSLLSSLRERNMSLEKDFSVRRLSETRRITSILRKSNSKESIKCHDVKFDPRVWVHEYEILYKQTLSNRWYNDEELKILEYETIRCIREYTLNNPGCPKVEEFRSKPFFCHPVLFDDEKLRQDNAKYNKLLKQNIKNILIVDPNKIFLYLFSKSLKSMLPHVEIALAKTSEEANSHIEKAKTKGSIAEGQPTHGFDIIVVEEQFYSPTNWPSVEECRKLEELDLPVTGSQFIQRITQEQEMAKKSMSNTCHSLVIGVSAQLDIHREMLQKSGADFVWNKPPPPMTAELKNKLFEAVMNKREKSIE